jgi:hypothetical protein
MSKPERTVRHFAKRQFFCCWGTYGSLASSGLVQCRAVYVQYMCKSSKKRTSVVYVEGGGLPEDAGLTEDAKENSMNVTRDVPFKHDALSKLPQPAAAAAAVAVAAVAPAALFLRALYCAQCPQLQRYAVTGHIHKLVVVVLVQSLILQIQTCTHAQYAYPVQDCKIPDYSFYYITEPIILMFIMTLSLVVCPMIILNPSSSHEAGCVQTHCVAVCTGISLRTFT